VFYTGLRRWPQIGTLADLIERGEEFRQLTPIVERPLLLNLPELSAAKLQRGGYFGRVLQLVQQRKTRAKPFRELVERVVAHLRTMPPEEWQRWRYFLFYIGAMVYHERDEREQSGLQEAIERSLDMAELREEILDMGKTMADVMMERGASQAAVNVRQQTLVRLLQRRFGDVPPGVLATVQSTTDVDQLDDWLDRLVTVSTFDELRIPAGS
jgi:hypothetical protein